MIEEFDEINNVKNLFAKILGSEVEIIDNLDGTKENVFIMLLEKLEASYKKETSLFSDFGIDVSLFTDDLWFVVEGFFKMLYGEEVSEMILWYLFDRINEKGEINEFIVDEEEGEGVIIKTPKELWDFIFSRKNLEE